MLIGIDTGGTFTDFVGRTADGRSTVLKVPSTPHDPSEAMLTGIHQLLGELGIQAGDVQRVVHGTTVATNAVLERKGARTGIIATRGFKDVLEIGRQIRSAVYELQLRPETPIFLAPGARRVEVAERVTADGEVLIPLQDDNVEAALATLVEQGVEAIAVSLLFSFLHPAHEERIRAIAKARYPHLHVSLSSEVDPAFREYERVVATAFDAYTKPVLTEYLTRIQTRLADAGIRAPLQVMQSRGGIAGATTAMQRPVRLFLSGPAAGVIGGAGAGSETMSGAATRLITVDIGGTSCDVALVSDGKPLVRPEGRIDGFEVRVPMVDVNAIGAGGGSIAWLDGAGGLRVGPHSAGAAPGPACYGQGGELPTVTDASLVLGYLDGDNFAGGSLTLDAQRAASTINECVASPLGLNVVQAALGIHRVVNAQMAEAMRLVSIRQGFDPRDFQLVALGGGGPVHACALAEELQIRRIIVPAHPGVLSAEGLLAAPVEHEVSVGFPHDLDATDWDSVKTTLASLDTRATLLMREEQVQLDAVSRSYSADVCYVGQSHYLEASIEPGDSDPLARIYERFVAQHEQVFGYSTAAPARLVNLRTIHRAYVSEEAGPQSSAAQSTRQVDESRVMYFDDAIEGVEVPVVDRRALRDATTMSGPVVIEQSDTTTVIRPGWQVRPHASGHLIVTREAE